MAALDAGDGSRLAHPPCRRRRRAARIFVRVSRSPGCAARPRTACMPRTSGRAIDLRPGLLTFSNHGMNTAIMKRSPG
jgi:hypothetical protein